MKLPITDTSEHSFFLISGNENTHQRDDYRKEDLPLRIDQKRLALVLRCTDSLNLKNGAKILYLGCGTGGISLQLMQRGFQVTVVDRPEEKIQAARHRSVPEGPADRGTFQTGDAELLDFPDNTFDAVIATQHIEYLTWDRWALQEIHRVLKPGSSFIITVPNNIGLSCITNPFHILSNLRVLGGSPRNDQKRGSVRKSTASAYRNFYIPSRFRQMLSCLGYENIRSQSYGFGPFFVLGRSDRLSIKLDQILEHWEEQNILPFLSELGTECLVLARKKEKTAGISNREIFQDMEKKRKKFTAENRRAISRLEAWLEQNPAYSHPCIRELDTVAYAGTNVLVISPHPDDEIIGCGGTLVRMQAVGSAITILQLTDGSSTSALKDSPERVRRTIRLQEARAVADSMGIKELIIFGENQAGFQHTNENINRLSELLNRLHPQVIFVPFINDPHPDHVAANEILCRSLKDSMINPSEIAILSYEVWSFVSPNCFCIIDNQFDKKTEMLMKYRTGMKVVDYVRFCEDLNAYHAYTLLGKKGYAEVFLKLDAVQYEDLIHNFRKAPGEK